MKQQRASRGFTLIEVMITVAIIAILAAVAYPSYREHIAKSRRAQVMTVLLGAQQWMERFYTENFRYDKNSAGVSVTDATQFPSRFSVSPLAGQGSPVYDITVTNNERDKFTITATRRAGGLMADDRCGDFSLDHLGRKDLHNFSSDFSSRSAAIGACWR